jgi:hypothetical protein
MTVIFLIRIQGGLHPLRMIGRVGILLALETDTHVLGVGDTMLADNCGISANTLEVSAVDLDTGLVGVHFHKDARLGRVKAGAYLCVVTFAILEGVQAEIMVITSGILNLVKV